MSALTTTISNAVVQIMHEYTGRGPTKSRATVAPDSIVVILRDCLTPGERQLVDEGKASAVLGVRQAYQDLMAAELIEAVEQATGRHVETLLSAMSTRPDITVNIFVATEL